jgi:hypothetical protein
MGPGDLASLPAAAMRLESTYGPRMRRLRQEIGEFERLMTLLTTA